MRPKDREAPSTPTQLAVRSSGEIPGQSAGTGIRRLPPLSSQLPAASPISCFVFFEWGTSLVSRTIMALTKGPSHCGLGFSFATPAVSSAIRVSCRATQGGVETVGFFHALPWRGVVGPRPWSELEAWLAQNRRRRVQVVPLAIPESAVPLAWLNALAYVGDAGYAELQLLAMALFEKIGLPVTPSRGRVVCSEFVARAVHPWLDLRSEGRNFDEVTPASLWRLLGPKNAEKNGEERRTADVADGTDGRSGEERRAHV